jgi:predicted RNase H-like HicB family nuclease
MLYTDLGLHSIRLSIDRLPTRWMRILSAASLPSSKARAPFSFRGRPLRRAMAKEIIVYGLAEFINEVWAVYIPDVEGLVGRGATRELAILDAEVKLRQWVAQQRSGREPVVRNAAEFTADNAVKVGLGMELVAIPL